MANDNAANFLAHYGIAGMRWGKRKSSVEVSSVPKPPASADAIKTGEFKQRAKAGGTAALNTKELQDLVNRQNLEQQYDRLNPAPVSMGRKLAGELLPSVGKIGYSAYRAYYPAPAPEPMSTALRPTSSKQKAADMVLHLGKEVVKAHGLELGMAIVKSLV